MKIQLLLLISFTFSISLFSQNKTGIGNVSDNSGIVIPNAIVQISPSSDTTIVYEYVCDKNGNYTYDIPSNDSVYTVNILPSIQTLQFSHNKEYITLSNGNNALIFHTVKRSNSHGINFTVTDTAGNPISGAKLILYDTQDKWKIDSCRIAKAVYTDNNGQVEIKSLAPIKYWFNVRKDTMTNRFTLDSTSSAIDTSNTTNITVVIRDLTQNELYMCGLCDNKTWITDSMIILGVTWPYDADTKLLSDATWWDSNGRYGYWWFNSDESVMTYNYLDGTSGGSVIDATNLTITDSTWVGDMQMMGTSVKYFMSVPNLDTINLSLSVQDTTIYLNSNGVANLTSDDLFINSSYCFTCNTTLSKSSFDMSDIGDNVVYVTMQDRCGNSVIDSLTITVAEAISTAITESAKSNINIYPNPASDFVLIESKDDRIKQVELYTMNGMLIGRSIVNNTQFSYRVSDLKDGLYLLKVYTSKGVIAKKIVVQK